MIVRRPVLMGNEQVPLHVIDDAHPRPDILRRLADDSVFRRLPGDFYPGLRADAPADYGAWLTHCLRALGPFTNATMMHATYAVVTDDAAALAPIQRIPHFDTPDPSVFALVHYLCDPPHGGTGFYRHRRTGYERILPNRQPAWRQALVQDGRQYGMPQQRYMFDGDERFDRIGVADLQFNRLILYPANCLHAGLVGQPAATARATDGRLTITALINLRA